MWDGPYGDAEFDRTDLVFGSAARLRGRAATFVSSASTVDRLHSLEAAASIWISNSLADYIAWLDAHRAQIDGGRRPLAGIARSVANTAIVGVRRTVGGLQQVARSASELVPLDVLVRLGKSHRLTTFADYEPAFPHVFPWALGRARDRYRA